MTLDTLFWLDVAIAHDQVSIDHSLQVTVERENKRALVKMVKGIVFIMIDEAPNEKPPTLIVPQGQGKIGES